MLGAGLASPRWDPRVLLAGAFRGREGRWEAMERAAQALLARPDEEPRALYAVAWGRSRALDACVRPPDGWRGVEGLLSACLAAGDEPRGRCAHLLGELRRAGRVR